MEHLFYRLSTRSFRAKARDVNASLPRFHNHLRTQWDHTAFDPIDPRYDWLGHDHEESSYFSQERSDATSMMELFTDQYGADWADLYACDDIRAAHISLRNLEDDEVAFQTAAYMQAWLYLGLLEAVCGRAIPISVVTYNTGSRVFLYSYHVPFLLALWRRDVPLDECYDKLQEARRCAQVAENILTGVFKKFEHSNHPLKVKICSYLRPVEPALTALHEFLSAFVEYHAEMEVRSFSPATSFFSRTYSLNLIQKGWCPFVVATAETSMSSLFLRYVDICGWSLLDGGHELCTGELCRRNQIVLEDYTQAHLDLSCRCRFIKPDLGQVFEILDANKIPVVEYLALEQKLQVGAIHPEDRKADYIAYSHVWADGLGSCTEKGLPKCQIERLHAIAGKKLVYGSWFWIDGLCVPRREPYRNTAVQLMKSTYRNPSGSVVLDNSLRHVSVSDAPLRIGWTLYASGWMGRLWTYQEGMLPPWVDLELTDGYCDLYQLVQNLYSLFQSGKNESLVSAILARDLLAALQKVRPLDQWHQYRDKARRLVDVFNALTRRLTSRPEDQLLVISLLLDLNTHEIMAEIGEARWGKLYLLLENIPWTIIFDRRPKLSSIPGFSWAPKTWISSGRDEYLHYSETLASCTEQGLQIALMVLVLDEVCESTERYLSISVGPDRYELARSAHTLCDISSREKRFDVILIRHFKNETPGLNLKTQPAWVRVGAALLRTRASDMEQEFAWYDTQLNWDMRYLDDSNGHDADAAESLSGNWEERPCVFI